MNFLNTVRIDLMKMRRSAAVWLSILGAGVIPLIFSSCISPSRPSFISKASKWAGWLILPAPGKALPRSYCLCSLSLSAVWSCKLNIKTIPGSRCLPLLYRWARCFSANWWLSFSWHCCWCSCLIFLIFSQRLCLICFILNTASSTMRLTGAHYWNWIPKLLYRCWVLFPFNTG